jgi:hypothetical protein
MTISRQKLLGWSLVIVGVLVAVLSEQIVFPGLERLLGIETIVGRESVVYQPEGGYVFTNPGAMIRWVSGVALVGFIVAFLGGFMLIRARRESRGSHVHAKAAS